MLSSVFNLTGLTCSACQKLIFKRVMKIEGVEYVDVQLDGKTIIGSDRQIKTDEVEKVLKDTKYMVIKSS